MLYEPFHQYFKFNISEHSSTTSRTFHSQQVWTIDLRTKSTLSYLGVGQREDHDWYFFRPLHVSSGLTFFPSPGKSLFSCPNSHKEDLGKDLNHPLKGPVERFG